MAESDIENTHGTNAIGVVCSALVRPLPCPHCGGPAELRRYQHDRNRVFYACADAACNYTYTDLLEALQAWNRRANDKVSDSRREKP